MTIEDLHSFYKFSKEVAKMEERILLLTKENQELKAKYEPKGS